MGKVVSFGELMLRLTPFGKEKILQNASFAATFGGAEANVAVVTAALGGAAEFVTALPDNELGKAALRELRKFNVATDNILLREGRMGLYFTETGSNMRPSKVLYDREYSAVSMLKRGDIHWEKVFRDADWFHISGITPALSQSLCGAALEAAMAAKKAGLTVSCDLNYRKNLWKWGKPASEVMPEFAVLSDVLIGNEEDCQKCLRITAEGIEPGAEADAQKYKAVAEKVRAVYPNIGTVAVSLRESRNADINYWSGVLFSANGFFASKKYELTHIVDRIGGGDSFSGALIYALKEYGAGQKAIDFAVAASALKHTQYGDFAMFELCDVERLAGGDGSGRIQR